TVSMSGGVTDNEISATKGSDPAKSVPRAVASVAKSVPRAVDTVLIVKRARLPERIGLSKLGIGERRTVSRSRNRLFAPEGLRILAGGDNHRDSGERISAP